jgi:glycyl-tRNA synthetase beta chain
MTGWIAGEAFGQTDAAEAARTAGRLAKADLTTDMVREFTELQGAMGGVYARADEQPESVWKALYYQYQPVGVDAQTGPTREQLGTAASTWAALSVADKLDSVVGLFLAGEVPTGTRDPFALRRQAQGLVKVLVDLPEVVGLDVDVDLGRLVDEALGQYASHPATSALTMPAGVREALETFLIERLKYLFERRGFAADEIAAVLPDGTSLAGLAPLAVRKRIEALRGMRTTSDFAALAALFKRATNIVKDLPRAAAGSYDVGALRGTLVDAAERDLAEALEARRGAIATAAQAGDYRAALGEIAELRPAVDRFFTDVFVMVDDAALRHARLTLLAALRDTVLDIADLSQIAGAPA